MSRESTDPLTDLATALDVEPSAGFAARVRRRFDTDHPTTVWGRWAAAIAAAVVAVLAGWLAIPSRPAEQSAGVAPAVAERIEPATVPSMSGARVSQPSAAVKPVVRRASRAAGRVAEPEVLVSPDQRLALDQLRTALADGRLDPSALPQNLVDAPPQLPAGGDPASVNDRNQNNPNLLQRLETPARYLGYRTSAD